jgi:hypothetical protein
LVRPLQELHQNHDNPRIDKEYRVEFRRRKVETGVGVWVVGGFEGVSDVSFSYARFFSCWFYWPSFYMSLFPAFADIQVDDYRLMKTCTPF